MSTYCVATPLCISSNSLMRWRCHPLYSWKYWDAQGTSPRHPASPVPRSSWLPSVLPGHYSLEVTSSRPQFPHLWNERAGRNPLLFLTWHPCVPRLLVFVELSGPNFSYWIKTQVPVSDLNWKCKLLGREQEQWSMNGFIRFPFSYDPDMGAEQAPRPNSFSGSESVSLKHSLTACYLLAQSWEPPEAQKWMRASSFTRSQVKPWPHILKVLRF